MNKAPIKDGKTGLTPYMSLLGLWAFAFGCSVGQGAFLMPGGTFLPSAGPIGTAVGIGLGVLVMLVLARNYHLLMNRYPDSGGTYTYTKKCFGYDHGFLSAWFLILCYVAILWANAIGLPFILRSFFGSTFQFGFDYEIAGFHVWFGEILIVFATLIVGALICLRRKLAENLQIVMSILLLVSAVICFAAAFFGRDTSVPTFEPAFAEDHGPLLSIFTIFALAPWAFAGFESVSHSAAEAKYPLKKTFRVLAAALICAGAAYVMLTLLAALGHPTDGSNPVFFAAESALGRLGRYLIGFAAAFGIFTGVIGNYIALSRLLHNLSEDRMLPEWVGRTDGNRVPRNAILLTLGVSVVIPFFGRAAISWIVDATTVGATIAYAFSSAAALKTARQEKSRSGMITGGAGVIISLFFVFAFLIPNLISVQTLATESYLILAAWGFLGYLMFQYMLRRDKERRLGRSNLPLIVMLGVIIFTSTVWMRQYSANAIKNTVEPIQNYYSEVLEEAGVDVISGATRHPEEYLNEVMNKVDRSLQVTTTVQIGVIVLTIAALFVIYALIQKREKQVEVEKALAEESSRAKTSFLSNMSHEIRTPMNAIIGLDNIALRDPDLTPKTREHLEKIGASARHLLGLINDILDMSRIESGRMVLKDEEFSFREFLDQVNIIINGQCLDKGLRYECQIVGQVNDYYFGDDMKLKQVLINILGNSVKFTDAPGSVTLTVEQTERTDEACTLRFQMIDTGIGMDKEYLPKIFEAFSQEDATTTNRYGGSGLGMAITKNFVEMMGGTIQVESEKGVGSTFTVTVSLRASDRSYHRENASLLPAGLRAIVVDDDEVACEHAKLVLSALKIEAMSFTRAEEALPILKDAFESDAPYDLLLTDYKMPGMSGRDLTRAVREFDGGKTAVIMLTGYNWDIVEEETRLDGVDAILAKPLFSDSLLRTIHEVLLHKNGSDAPSEEIRPAEKSPLTGRRILMAEDVDANAEILGDLLELEEMEVERAVNGQRAVEMFSEKPAGYYDAILMDVRMPVMDGLAATESIRALPREDAKVIPIIAMTANVFDEDVERSLAAGMNAHLFKPIEPDKLYAKLAELIGE